MSAPALDRLAGQKHARPTKAEHAAFLAALAQIVEDVQPCTVRQVYYQAVVRDLIEKTEREYDRVQAALVKLRESGIVPWEYIVDATRWVRRNDSWASPAAALENAARMYRKSLWAGAENVPEIWLEKDALAGVVFDVSAEWDVGLYTARGYASLPFLHSAALDIVARLRRGQGTAIYHLGDFDPSGRDAARAIRERLGEFCAQFGAWKAFSFVELAVNEGQIEHFNLPLRPTKLSDSRAAAFIQQHGEAGSVELDAIAPSELRRLVREAIETHMPPEQLAAIRVVEQEERRGLAALARTFSQRPA